MKFKLPSFVIVSLLTIAAFLGVINWDIYQKEQQLIHGRVVRLALAPVDPRSLMQGDYMALNYAIATPLRARLDMEIKEGLLQVKLDDHQVASLVALDEGINTDRLPETLQKPHGLKARGERISIQYRVRHNQIKFASNAYFFEEGQAKRYEAAKYGQFRVNERGELLLEFMLDKDFNPL